jgi:hypothetical protein
MKCLVCLGPKFAARQGTTVILTYEKSICASVVPRPLTRSCGPLSLTSSPSTTTPSSEFLVVCVTSAYASAPCAPMQPCLGAPRVGQQRKGQNLL